MSSSGVHSFLTTRGNCYLEVLRIVARPECMGRREGELSSPLHLWSESLRKDAKVPVDATA